MRSSNNGIKLNHVGVVCVLAMLCCALWGSVFPCVKIGYELFAISPDDSASQILFAGLRFTLAGCLVILFGSIQGKQPLKIQRDSFHKVLILSLFQTILQYTFFYMAMARTTAVNGSILNGSAWFFAILVAALLFRIERLNVKKILGCVLGFAGIVLVNLNGAAVQLQFGAGDVLMLLAAFFSAMSTVCMKIFAEKENPVVLSGYQFLIGGLVLTGIATAAGGRLHPTSGLAFVLLLYMALISSVAYTVWGILLRHNPVSLVGIFGFMTPVFGVILSAVFAGEAHNLGMFTLIALVLVCLGIWQVQRRRE